MPLTDISVKASIIIIINMFISKRRRQTNRLETKNKTKGKKKSQRKSFLMKDAGAIMNLVLDILLGFLCLRFVEEVEIKGNCFFLSLSLSHTLYLSLSFSGSNSTCIGQSKMMKRTRRGLLSMPPMPPMPSIYFIICHSVTLFHRIDE